MPELVSSPSPELVIAAGAILPPICTVFVILRCMASRAQAGKSYIEDWLTVSALVLLWAQGICLIVGAAKHALGYVQPDGVNPFTISTPETILSRQLLYATLLIQIPGLTLVKLSFVFFYRRIFVPPAFRGSKLDWFLRIFGATLVAWALAFFFTELFICRTSFDDVWISKTTVEQSQECVQLEPFDLAFTISDFLLDLTIILTPIRPLFSLRLSLGQKLGLCGVFSLGAVAVAASITRFVVFTDEEDMTVTIAVYWTCLETALALLACCLPPVFGFLNNIRRKRVSSSSGWRNILGASATEKSRNNGMTRLHNDASEPQRWPSQNEIKVTTTFGVSSEERRLENGVR